MSASASFAVLSSPRRNRQFILPQILSYNDMMGNKVGDFEIIKPLGEGAVGAAYQARHVESGEVVAIKLLLDELANEPDMQKRFVREVAVLEKLNHSGIVRHRDCGLHDGQIYFAMELVDSGSLDEVLQEGGVLPWREAAEVAQQVSAALAHAHLHGVIHRDLKPANLFLTSEGKVKIGDFGLARDNKRHRLTMTGQTVGTCRYMAPEQVRGEDELTGAVDMYALGCLLHLMTVGRCPFGGDSVVEVFEHHLFSTPKRLDTQGIDCPDVFVELVDRLLAKDPEDRPDAVATEAALSAILQGHRPSLPERPEGDEEEEPNLTDRLKENTTRPLESKPSYAVLIVAVVIAAITVIAVVMAQG